MTVANAEESSMDKRLAAGAALASRNRSAIGRAVEDSLSRLAGLPPATTDFTVTRRVSIPMRDGIELAADLYRPTTGAVGTLLIRGPYGRQFVQAFPMARVFAARGYNALFVSSRGTFGSGGDFYPMKTEVDDGHDVVAWMTAQPWFTGTFATVGGSYLGHTQLALLTDPPTELATAVISIAPHDFARHAWGTGAFRLDFLGWSSQVVHQEDGNPLVALARIVRNARRLPRFLDQLPLTAPASTLLAGRAPWYVDWVTRPDLSDSFWAPMRHAAALDRVDVPVLLVGGWQDLFMEQTLEQYERLHARGLDVALTVGAWSHLQAAKALRIVTRETFDWLEEHLARRAPRRRSSPVRVYVTGVGEWRNLDQWPPETTETAWFLQPSGGLAAEPPTNDAPPSSFTFDPADPTPTVGGPLLSGKSRADDSPLAARTDVLTFTGPALTAAFEVTGSPVVELAHGTDHPYADLFVRISEVHLGGRCHNITEAYTRLNPDRGDRPVVIRLRPMAHRFSPGSRLRLLVAGGCHPQYSRNLGTGENPGRGVALRPSTHTVFHGQGGCSKILLPIGSWEDSNAPVS
jgi:putative CocE/NonD family hydrolase